MKRVDKESHWVHSSQYKQKYVEMDEYGIGLQETNNLL
jgi:hypothetical protein